MGSNENHFNVSLTVSDKVTRQCPQTTTLEEKGETKWVRTEVLLLTSLTKALPQRPNRLPGLQEQSTLLIGYWGLNHTALLGLQNL